MTDINQLLANANSGGVTATGPSSINELINKVQPVELNPTQDSELVPSITDSNFWPKIGGDIGELITRGIPHGVGIVGEQLGGAVQAVGDLLWDKSISNESPIGKLGREQAEASREYAKQWAPKYNTIVGPIVDSAYTSIYAMLPGMALAATGAGTPAALTTMGLMTGGQKYSDMLDKGFSREDAATGGLIEGGLEVATEAAGGALLFPMLRMLKAGDEPVKNYFKQFAKYMVSDGIGEQFATLTQGMNDKHWQDLRSTDQERKDKAVDYLIGTFTGGEGTTDQIVTFFSSLLASGAMGTALKIGNEQKKNQYLSGQIKNLESIFQGLQTGEFTNPEIAAVATPFIIEQIKKHSEGTKFEGQLQDLLQKYDYAETQTKEEGVGQETVKEIMQDTETLEVSPIKPVDQIEGIEDITLKETTTEELIRELETQDEVKPAIPWKTKELTDWITQTITEQGETDTKRIFEELKRLKADGLFKWEDTDSEGKQTKFTFKKVDDIVRQVKDSLETPVEPVQVEEVPTITQDEVKLAPIVEQAPVVPMEIIETPTPDLTLFTKKEEVANDLQLLGINTPIDLIDEDVADTISILTRYLSDIRSIPIKNKEGAQDRVKIIEDVVIRIKDKIFQHATDENKTKEEKEQIVKLTRELKKYRENLIKEYQDIIQNSNNKFGWLTDSKGYFTSGPFKGYASNKFDIVNDKLIIDKTFSHSITVMMQEIYSTFDLLKQPLVILEPTNSKAVVKDKTLVHKFADSAYGQYFHNLATPDVIFINNSSSQAIIANTLFHEFGHYVMFNYAVNARQIFSQQYANYIDKISQMTVKEFWEFRYGAPFDQAPGSWKPTANDNFKSFTTQWDYYAKFEDWFAYTSAEYLTLRKNTGDKAGTFFERVSDAIYRMFQIFQKYFKIVDSHVLHTFYESLRSAPDPTLDYSEFIHNESDLVAKVLFDFAKKHGELTLTKAKTIDQRVNEESFSKYQELWQQEIEKRKQREETFVKTIEEGEDVTFNKEAIVRSIKGVLLKGSRKVGVIRQATKESGGLSLFVSKYKIDESNKQDLPFELQGLVGTFDTTYNIELRYTVAVGKYETIAWVPGVLLKNKRQTLDRIANNKDLEAIVDMFINGAKQITEGKIWDKQLLKAFEDLGIETKPQQKGEKVIPKVQYIGMDGNTYQKQELAEQFGGGVRHTIEEKENFTEIIDSALIKFNASLNSLQRSIIEEQSKDESTFYSINPYYESKDPDTETTEKYSNKVNKQLKVLEELDKWARAQGKTIQEIYIEKGGSPEKFDQLIEAAGEAWTKRQNKRKEIRIQTLQGRAIAIAEGLGFTGSKFYRVVSKILDDTSDIVIGPEEWKTLEREQYQKVIAWMELLYRQQTGEKFKYRKTIKRTQVEVDTTQLPAKHLIPFLKEELWLRGDEYLDKTPTGKKLAENLWTLITKTDSHAGQLLALFHMNEKYIQDNNDRLLRMYLGEEEFNKGLLEGEKFDERKYKNIDSELDAKILKQMKIVYNTLGKMMEDRAIVIQNFDGKKTIYVHDFEKAYFPHTFKQEDLSDNGPKFKQLKASIKKQYKVTDAVATKLLKTFIRNRGSSKKFGNMEYARDFDVAGWERDIMAVTTLYTIRGLKRLYSIDQFGKKSEKGIDIVAKFEQEGGNFEHALQIFQQIVGYTNQKDVKWRRFADLAISYEIITKMGLSFFSNITQSINTIAYSPKAFLKTISSLTSKMTREESLQFAHESGALLGTVLKEYVDFQRGENLSDLFLRKVGFTKAEIWNRIFASVAGKKAAEIYFQDLKNNSEGSKAYSKASAMLKTLGLNVKELKNQTELTKEDLYMAGLTMANKSQFRSNALTLPKFIGDDPRIRLITLLHTFSYHQSKMIVDTFKNRKENLIPLLIAMLGAGGAGDALKRFITGRKFPENELEAIIGALSAGGGFGILFDMIRSANTGKGALLSAFAGPVVSDVASVGSALVDGFVSGVQWAQGESDFEDVLTPIGKEAIKIAPYTISTKSPVAGAISAGVRPLLSNYLFPSKSSRFE